MYNNVKVYCVLPKLVRFDTKQIFGFKAAKAHIRICGYDSYYLN